MRLFIGILVGILVLFQYDLWFGKNGYFDYKDVAAQIKENKAEKWKALTKKSNDFSWNSRVNKKALNPLKKRARMGHDMVKPNEVFYHIVKEHK